MGLGLYGDLHEFHTTEHGTALITIYNDIELDFTTVGVNGKCWIDDCLFQEIDIETGNLLFQWRASDHVPLTDSNKTRGRDGDGTTPEMAYDFFHINSIEKDVVGNYIISARHMYAIYCINSAGDIVWTPGGNTATSQTSQKAMRRILPGSTMRDYMRTKPYPSSTTLATMVSTSSCTQAAE